MAGLYIHIPFCQSRCTYCDFTSYPKRINQAQAYMACVYKEIKMRGYEYSKRLFNTIYIGGGTPSIIEPTLIAGLVKALKQDFNVERTAEITIEINPATVDKQKIEIYKKAGINRFSIGLQTANDTLLQNLNRKHTAQDFLDCANLLKGENISVDILIGIPNQTQADIQAAIELAVLGGASHISMYALKAEEGTPLFTAYLNAELPCDDEIANQYDFGVNTLNAHNFKRYEVSNFCKNDKVSRHNLNYWNRGEYLGFGVCACSFSNQVRFTNTLDFDEYIQLIVSNRFATIVSEQITKEQAKFEKIMLALRTDKGLNIKLFDKEFEANFLNEFAKPLKKHMPYLDLTSDYLRIKPEFLFMQNNIIIDFIN